jgi:hypothetical protein
VQFDRGVGLFVLLLLVKLLVARAAGVSVAGDRAGEFLVAAFFLFALVAMGLAHEGTEVQRSFRAGFQGLGVVLTVSATVVLFASGFTLLFYAQLTQAADSIQVVLRAVGRPVGRVLVAILLFLFSPKRFRNPEPAEYDSQAPGIPIPVHGAAATLLTRALGLALAAAVGLLALGILALLVGYLVRLLLKRGGAAGVPRTPGFWLQRLLALLALLAQLAQLPGLLWSSIARMRAGLPSAAAVYGALRRWGGRSGLPALASETPSEYGVRLARWFPRLRQEIATITAAYNREVYGEIAVNRGDLSRLLCARRRMRSPRHWPSRLRVLSSA